MAQHWEDLSSKQQKKFGSKSNFKSAKRATRRAGGDVSSAKAIVKTYKGGGSSGGSSNSGGGGGVSSAQVKNFDYGATVGSRDVRKMRSAGFSDAQIKSVAERAGVGNVKASVQKRYGLHGAASPVENLENYDVDSIGRTTAKKDGSERVDLNKAEIRHLLDSNHSATEINDWAKRNNYTMGTYAQSFLNKRLNSMTNQPPTDITAETPETPQIDTKPDMPAPPQFNTPDPITAPEMPEFKLPEFDPQPMPMPPPGGIPGEGGGYKGTGDFTVGRDLNQNVGKVQGDQELHFTNTGTFIGNNNQGADYSVTIGMNQAGNNAGTPAYNSNNAMMGNIMSGAALGALNDNAYHKSQSQLSGATRGAQDIYRTEQIKNTQGRADALRYNAALRPQYWQSRATLQSNLYLGDLYGMRAPSFVMPKPPKQPEADLEGLADKYS